MLEPQDRSEMRILLVVVAGFVAGILLLFYIIVTDL